MIYITGDTHGEMNRFQDFRTNYNEDKWTEKDTLIVCGDFGYIFKNNKEENDFLDYLEKNKPYNICFLDGNHECFPAIYDYPVVNFCKGKAHRIRKNIYHLMRSQIFEIEGKSFFTMGGAYSIDKGRRIPGVSWWPEEKPTDEEYKEAVKNLKKHNMRVDYILTHTMPKEMILRYGKSPDAHDLELTGFLEWVMYEVEYRHWYCGHWHDFRELDNNITILWFDVREI